MTIFNKIICTDALVVVMCQNFSQCEVGGEVIEIHTNISDYIPSVAGHAGCNFSPSHMQAGMVSQSNHRLASHTLRSQENLRGLVREN